MSWIGGKRAAGAFTRSAGTPTDTDIARRLRVAVASGCAARLYGRPIRNDRRTALPGHGIGAARDYWAKGHDLFDTIGIPDKVKQMNDWLAALPPDD